MSGTKPIASKRNISDAVIDGLIAGVFAGLGMGAYLVAGGIAYGENPLIMLARFDSNTRSSFWIGALTHLAVSGAYGAVFGMMASLRFQPISSRLFIRALALGYGLSLFAIAELIILPGVKSSLIFVPVWHFTIAHLIYGLLLGFGLTRN